MIELISYLLIGCVFFWVLMLLAPKYKSKGSSFSTYGDAANKKVHEEGVLTIAAGLSSLWPLTLFCAPFVAAGYGVWKFAVYLRSKRLGGE